MKKVKRNFGFFKLLYVNLFIKKKYTYKKGEYSLKQYADEYSKYIKSKCKSKFRFKYTHPYLIVKDDKIYDERDIFDLNMNFKVDCQIANSFVSKIEFATGEYDYLEATIYLYKE